MTVTVDGSLFGTYSLEEDREISIGEGNRLRIEGGEAFMTWASCPDGLCIRQGRISRVGETVVCLPHQVVVEVIKGKPSDLDGIAG